MNQNHVPFTQANREPTQLVSNIKKAINGEFSAIHCYEKLAKMTHSEKERKQILEIRKDEIKHFQQFSQVYTQLTGREPNPKISEECPDTLRKGLKFAFKDEQETVDFYLDISDQVHDPYIQEIFRRAATDEQNHAVWFLFYYLKNK